MPLALDWRETEETVELEVAWRSSKKRPEDVLVVDWFVRVNVLGDGLEAVDLHKPVDSERAELVYVGESSLHIKLPKKEKGVWGRLRAEKERVGKEEIMRRREEGMQQQERRAQETERRKQEEKTRKEKVGEQETWRQETEKRDHIEKWKQEIKQQAVQQAADFSHSSPGSNSNSASIPATEALNAQPRAMRGQSTTIGLNFTARAVPGAPAREKRDGAAAALPEPSQQLADGSGAGRGGSEVLWMKDKGDGFMEKGDYKAAFFAYSEALEKGGENVRVLGNRAVACMYLSRVSVALEDVQRALSALSRKRLLSDEEEFVKVTLLLRAAQCELMTGNLRAAGRYAAEAERQASSSRLVSRRERAILAGDAKLIAESIDFVARKKKADAAFRDGLYDRASEVYGEFKEKNAVIRANVGVCALHRGAAFKDEAVQESEGALRQAKQSWSAESGKPVHIGKLLSKRQVLERIPNLDDPTLADVAGKDDWLMKQENVTRLEDLPAIPSEWEWVRDAKEQHSWVAKRRRLTEKEREDLGEKMAVIREVCEQRDSIAIRQLADQTAEQTAKLHRTAEQMRQYADQLETLGQELALAMENRAGGFAATAGSGAFVEQHMTVTTRTRLVDKIEQRLASLGN